MHTLPIYRICEKDATVNALIGSHDGVRVYEFGETNDPEPPYAVWQDISGSPLNYMDEAAKTDKVTVQIDVYASDKKECSSCALAIRSALESNKCITERVHTSGRDTRSKLYRVGFDITLQIDRTERATP